MDVQDPFLSFNLTFAAVVVFHLYIAVYHFLTYGCVLADEGS